jgi:hypothetical protein
MSDKPLTRRRVPPPSCQWDLLGGSLARCPGRGYSAAARFSAFIDHDRARKGQGPTLHRGA